MKKIVLIVAILSVYATAWAQVPHGTNGEKAYAYCEIVGTGKLFSHKVTIVVDMGEKRGFFEDTTLRDEDGKKIVFNSMVDAMNFMGSDGWQFVQAYVVTMGQQNVYHWLLKKEFPPITAE